MLLPPALACTLFAALAPTTAVAARTVAVIGAGAGGASAAFWLSLARDRDARLGFALDVYERDGYVGGRTSFLFSTCGPYADAHAGSTIVHPYDNSALTPVELGASIFKVGDTGNQVIQRAAAELGLRTAPFGLADTVDAFWDGHAVVVEVCLPTACMIMNGLTRLDIGRRAVHWGSPNWLRATALMLSPPWTVRAWRFPRAPCAADRFCAACRPSLAA
jgi:hypothetical protein